MTIEQFIGLIGAVGIFIGAIKYLVNRRSTTNSLDAATLKTNKEIEQLQQEIDAKHIAQVKQWVEDLKEISEKHESELNEKNLIIENLHKQHIDLIKASKENLFKVAQVHRAMRRLFVNLEIPYWECDKDGKLLYANGKWLQLFGLSLDEALGEGWIKGIPETEVREVLVEWYSKVIDQSDGHIVFNVKNAVTGRTGRLKSLYVVAFDANSDVESIFGTTVELPMNY